jgi:hypothetical protein
MPEETIRERVATLEVELRHVNEKLEIMGSQVSEMHGLLLQARGARWAVWLMMAGLGALATKLGGMIAALGLAK